MLPRWIFDRISKAHSEAGFDGLSPFCPGQVPHCWPELELRLARPLPPDAISVVLPDSPRWLVLINEDSPVPLARWEASRAVVARLLVGERPEVPVEVAFSHPLNEALAVELVAPMWAVERLGYDAARVAEVLDLPPAIAKLAARQDHFGKVYAT